jgi:hypothetical protein
MNTRSALFPCVSAVLFSGCVSTVHNDATSTPTQITTFSGRVQRVWNFYALNPDCTLVGIPIVEVTLAASHGSVVVQNEENFTSYPSTNQRFKCNEKRSQTATVIYTSEKLYVGTDRFVVKSVGPWGDVVTREFAVTIERPQATPTELNDK